MADLEPEAKDINKVEVYEKRMAILGIGHLDCEELTDHQKQVIYDEHSFRCWMKFKLFKKSMEDIDAVINSKNDIFCEIIKSDLYRIKCLKQLVEYMGIDDVFKHDVHW